MIEGYIELIFVLGKYPDILTVKETKEILRCKSNSTIYHMVRDGRLQVEHEWGERYLIPKVSVIRFLLGLRDRFY